MRSVAVLVVVVASCASARAGDLEDELSEIVARLDSDDAPARDLAGGDLDAWCDRAGGRARELLEAAQPGKSPEVTARLRQQVDYLSTVEKAREFTAAFDAFGLPPAAKLRFVRYNTGGHTVFGNAESLEFWYRDGWLLEETPEILRLADTMLDVREWTRNRELPKNWDAFKAAHPADLPLPGDYRVLDFDALCAAALQDPGDEKDPLARLFHAQRGGLPEAAEAALYARWCLERRKPRMALALLARARQVAERERDSRPHERDKRTADELIVTSLAVQLRHAAITGAQEGLPRAELHRKWVALSRLPSHAYSAAAARTAALYATQLEEDRTWKTLIGDELASRTRPEQAEYWIHELRDLAAMQGGQPGHCSVFMLWRETAKGPNPAEKLADLGWDAVPAVLEHLDDMQPTRSVGYWRNFAPDTYHLLTFKDACEQVFEVITGVQIWDTRSTHDYPSFDRDPDELKRTAAACWRIAKEKGPEAAYAAMLPLKPDIAAAKLLALDASAWLPKLKQSVLDGNAGSDRVLWQIRESVWKTDHDFLAALLKAPDLECAATAADWLRDFQKDPSGVAVLRDRLAALPPDPPERTLAAIPSALHVIDDERTPENAAAWAGYLRHPCRTLRVVALIYASWEPSRAVLETVALSLNDTTCTDDVWPPGSGPAGLRACDRAASTLVRTLGIPVEWPWDGTTAERDAALSKVRSWYAENAARIDWEAVWAREGF